MMPEQQAENKTSETPEETVSVTETKVKKDGSKDDHKKHKAELEAAQKALSAEHDSFLRLAAEYDNFRKRTKAERDNLFAEAYGELLKALLPTFDNIERALGYNDINSLKDGLNLTVKSLIDTLSSLGIEQTQTETFDPNLHNAVMHIEDAAFGERQIVEVLQKGYKKGDKIIRYAMVKVAN